MKSAQAAFLIALLLPLPACQGLGALTTATAGTVSDVAPQAMADAKKALAAAHSLHASVANFLTIAATTDLCKSACAVTAKTYLDQSYAYLKAADAAVQLGDAPGITAKIASATNLLGQIQQLVGKK